MKITNKLGLPDNYVNAVRVYRPKSDRISVTHLVNPPMIRKLLLEKWNEIKIDAADFWKRMLGIGFHDLLESDDENSETYISTEFDGFTISGRADLYVPKTQELIDIKTTSVWAVLLGKRQPEWERQLNCYAWLFRRQKKPVRSLAVWAFLVDWSDYERRKRRQYPDNDILKIEIPLWSYERQEKYVAQRVKAHKNPRPCTPEERWATKDIWAAKRTGNRLPRLFESREEAAEYLEKGPGGEIEYRPGENRRCNKYCIVSSVCPYKNETSES